MRYVILSENLEEGKSLQVMFNCDLYSFNDNVNYHDYDFFILMYDVNKGRCSNEVLKVSASIYNKYVALVGRGNTGFDINNILMKRLKRNSTLVVYSKYYKKDIYEKIYDEIVNKRVRTDGKEFSERFVGQICRLIFRRNWK